MGVPRDRIPPRFFLEGGPERRPQVGAVTSLSDEDSHHAARVLRLRRGETCELVWVGEAGRVWEARVVEVGPPVQVQFERVREEPPASPVSVLLVQALLIPAKMDDVVDKGTQVGVDAFVVVPAAGSPRADLDKATARLERWRRIAKEAAKQSRQPSMPSVHLETSPGRLMEELVRQGWDCVVLDPSAAEGLSGRGTASGVIGSQGSRKVALWVGPEQGWTDAEVDAFRRAGGRCARLGRRVLRTETAGPVAAAVVRFMLDEW